MAVQLLDSNACHRQLSVILDRRPRQPSYLTATHVTAHSYDTRPPTQQSSYLTATHVTTHSYDTRLPTWQSSYLTATHVTAHSYDTRLPTWQSSYLTATHVTAHSYDTRLPTWQSSYLACHRKFKVGTRVTSHLGYHPDGPFTCLATDTQE